MCGIALHLSLSGPAKPLDLQLIQNVQNVTAQSASLAEEGFLAVVVLIRTRKDELPVLLVRLQPVKARAAALMSASP